jgi:hypothetical protein
MKRDSFITKKEEKYKKESYCSLESQSKNSKFLNCAYISPSTKNTHFKK